MSARHRDLCSTCNHLRTCETRGTARRPVFYCEEFDAYVPVAARPASASEPEKKAGPDKYGGLCCNCDNRHTCVVPKPESGIWHCEEYR